MKGSNFEKGRQQVDWLQRPTDPDPVEVSIASVRKQRTMQGAIVLCATSSGMEPKQIYKSLDIDPATWTKIMSGTAYFPPNKLSPFMDICGNEAPLIWLSEARGWDFASFRKHLSDEQRIIEEQRQEIASLRRTLKHVVESR